MLYKQQFPDSNHSLGQRWHFVGSFVRQMTLTRCHFAHRADIFANDWFDVGPTPIAQQAQPMPTYCQPFSFTVTSWYSLSKDLSCGHDKS